MIDHIILRSARENKRETRQLLQRPSGAFLEDLTTKPLKLRTFLQFVSQQKTQPRNFSALVLYYEARRAFFAAEKVKKL